MTSAVTAALVERVQSTIRNIPGFPKPGVLFRDITPLLEDPGLFSDIVGWFGASASGKAIDVVAGIEARGFVFASPLAIRLGCGFVPIRKPGRLPYRTVRAEYELEYGTDALEVHADAIRPGQRVLIVDDVLATGGTAAAAARLVETLGGEVAGMAFVVELAFLRGRERLSRYPVESLVCYPDG